MAEISALENLPDISVLDDEGITLEGIQNEMIADYEAAYREISGEQITLYPADERRIALMVAAGKLYQMYEIINERFRLNFLQYMYGDYLKNWAGNFGFMESGIRYAHVTLRFYISEVWESAVGIPQGTRVTAGDNIFFATDEYAEILPGEAYADVSATCTVEGAAGNDYAAGQINTIADPVNRIASAENINISAGGHDEYTDDELKELIYNFPSTYSTAGPEDCYIQFAKGYSGDIIDVRVVTTKDALVQIYVMCAGGKIPNRDFCGGVSAYISDLRATPDTDKVEVLAPKKVEYALKATYYISNDRKDIAENIQESVSDAVDAFIDYTHSKIGCDINPDILTAYASAAGARRIVIEAPAYTIIDTEQVAICTSAALIYGGLENE